MNCSAGGEGATAREVLRHKSVKEVVMVDIDKVGVHGLRNELNPSHSRACCQINTAEALCTTADLAHVSFQPLVEVLRYLNTCAPL